MKLDNRLAKAINPKETRSRVIRDFEDYEELYNQQIAELEKAFKEEIERIGKAQDAFILADDVEQFNSSKMIAIASATYASAAKLAYEKLSEQLITNENYINDLAASYASRRGGMLVQGITSQTRSAIRNAVATGLNDGADITETTRRIRKVIGLDDRGVRAVSNLRRNLSQQGVNPAKISKQVDAYSDKLLNQRAKLIARTEMQQAIETAKLDIWKSSGKPVYVQWITDSGPCGKCAPSSGDVTIAGQYFQTSLGAYESPPLHPNCRCQLHELRYSV